MSAEPPKRRPWRAIGVSIAAFVVVVVVLSYVWPTNERRLAHLQDEFVATIAPPGQTIDDAVSTKTVVGDRHWLFGSVDHHWLLGGATDSSVSRSFRLPDDADARAIILDIGRQLVDDGWKDLQIVCDSRGLEVRAWQRARVRLVDSFTMYVTVGVENGVYLEDPDEPWGPTWHTGGLGLNIYLTAPPVRDTDDKVFRNDPPTVRREEGCTLDSIVGDEGDLLSEDAP